MAVIALSSLGLLLHGLAPSVARGAGGLADPLLHALGFGAWAAAVATALRRADAAGHRAPTGSSQGMLSSGRAPLGVFAVVALGASLRWLGPSGSPTADAALAGTLEHARGPSVALALVIAPALCEEALFRGAALQWSARRAGSKTAAFVSALAFAAFHPSHPIQAGLFGLALAALALATGRVREAVVAHAAHNAIGLWVVGGTAAAPACAFAVAIGLASGVALALARRLRSARVRGWPSG